jgi:hypothetical protein
MLFFIIKPLEIISWKPVNSSFKYKKRRRWSHLCDTNLDKGLERVDLVQAVAE